MKPVEQSPKARDDLERIGDYIAVDNPRRPASFVQELRERCRHLAACPEAGARFPALGEKARFLVHGTYVILYRALDDRVRVERVLHGARDIRTIASNES